MGPQNWLAIILIWLETIQFSLQLFSIGMEKGIVV